MQPRSDSQQCSAAANNSEAVSLTDSKKLHYHNLATEKCHSFQVTNYFIENVDVGAALTTSFCVLCSLCNYDFLTHNYDFSS